MSEAAIQNAMEAARVFLASTEERRRYINREMARMDRESQLEEAYERGFKEGYDRGFQRGFEQGIAQGVEKGIVTLALEQLPVFMTKMNLSLHEAMDLLRIPENLRQAVQEAFKKKSNEETIQIMR